MAVMGLAMYRFVRFYRRKLAVISRFWMECVGASASFLTTVVFTPPLSLSAPIVPPFSHYGTLNLTLTSFAPPLPLLAPTAPLYSCLLHSPCLCPSWLLRRFHPCTYSALDLTLTLSLIYLKHSLGQDESSCAKFGPDRSSHLATCKEHMHAHIMPNV